MIWIDLDDSPQLLWNYQSIRDSEMDWKELNQPGRESIQISAGLVFAPEFNYIWRTLSTATQIQGT